MQGLKQTTTGDTLCDPANQVILESMTFPEPVIQVAIEPKSKADQEKLGTAIQRLAEEDPTFRVKNDEETGQTIIAGMGELHLDILVDRMRREFSVEANIGKPQVAYRETIKGTVDKIDYVHKKQTGGSGQYANVIVKLEPLEMTADGPTYEFVNAVSGGRSRRSSSLRSTPAPRTRCNRRARGLPAGGRELTLLDGGTTSLTVGNGIQIAGSMVMKEAASRATYPPRAVDGRRGHHPGREHG